MCGIVGSFDAGAGADLEPALRRMLALIRHRGPDQFGLLVDGGLGLGSARLSILDLATGQQPIGADGHWLVFNGELFNDLDLRQELTARGHRFATRSDTETLLRAWLEWGPACLDRLNGQFAFALWDGRRRRLVLARDRLGVRPLFYARAGAGLVFASEIKALFAHPGLAPVLDPAALEDVFTYWSPQAPATAFRGVAELPPGHWLEAGEDGVQVRRWWRLDFPGPVPAPDRRALVEAFRGLLVDATRRRLRADVPVGAYLSGGLDSSTLAAVIRGAGDSPLETFSIAFEDPRFDERAHQERMARALGTRHHVLEASHADIGRVFPDVVWHAETPLTRTAPAPMYLLSGLVRRQGFKVVLSGEGADEFLAGYDLFKEAKVRRFWARCPGSRLRPALLAKIYPWLPELAGAGGFLQAFFGRDLERTGDPAYSHLPRWRTTARCKRFLAPGPPQPARDFDWPEGFDRWDPLEQAQFLEVETFLSPYLLSSQGDRVAMAHAVEGRFPFLDPRLVDFCGRLPVGLKLRGLTEKVLLKEAAAGWVPPEVAGRTKQPYRAPAERCFLGQDYARDLLEPAAVAAWGLFRPAAVAQLAAKFQGGERLGETDGMALVAILSTQLLAHRFLRAFPRPDPIGAGDDLKRVVLDAGPGARP